LIFAPNQRPRLMSESESKPMEADISASAAAPSPAEAAQETKPETEDQKTEEKKEKKKSKKKQPKAKSEEVPASLHASTTGRQRKQTAFFTPQSSDSTDKEPDIKQGPGTALNDIPNVAKHLAAAKKKEKYLKALHRLLFPGSHPKEATVKINIGKFSGFVPALTADEKDSMETKLQKHEVRELRDIADLLDLSHSGTKNELSSAIVTFLEKPKDSGRPYKPKGKRSHSSSKKKGGDSEKGLSPFILFSKAIRPQVLKESPGASFGEVGKLIGEKWRKLSDKEKAKYGQTGSGSKPKKAGPKRTREETESEDENDDDEKPVAPPSKKKKSNKDLQAKMLSKIKGILSKVDIDTLTMRQVKEALASDFDQEDIQNQKTWLKDQVTKEIQKIKGAGAQKSGDK